MAEIKQLKEKKTDEIFYPVTVGEAVMFEDGRNLKDKIENSESEKVFAAAINDLNSQMADLKDQLDVLNIQFDSFDSRTYRSGAILDLSGANNPNYDVFTDEYYNSTFTLKPDVLNAISGNKISVIMAPLSNLFSYINYGTSSYQIAPYFLAGYAVNNGSTDYNTYRYVLMNINQGNMSEDGVNKMNLNWYDQTIGLDINLYTGEINLT